MEFEILGCKRARKKQSQQTPRAQLKHYWLRSIAVEIAQKTMKSVLAPKKNRIKILQNKLFLNVFRLPKEKLEAR